MASRTHRFPILVAAAALASHLPSTGHAEPTHAEGRSENCVGSEAVPSGKEDRGWIDADLFGKLVLESPR